MTHLDVELVTWLRGEFVTATAELEQHTALPPAAGVSYKAVGNAPSAGMCFAVWQETAPQAQTAYGHLRFSVKADIGRLDAIMNVFQRQDAESADDITAAAMRSETLDVYNTHVASGGNNPEANQTRSDQMNRAVHHIEGTPNPSVFAGDMNAQVPDQVDRLKRQGWTDASNDAVGQPVGTHHGNPIDKVYVGPGVGVTGPARTVDGGPSDHDGLVVDVGVAPAWP